MDVKKILEPFVAKNYDARLYLHVVHTTPDFTEASDGKFAMRIPHSERENCPDYPTRALTQVFKSKDKPISSITVDASYLEKVSAAMRQYAKITDQLKYVRIDFYASDRALLFTLGEKDHVAKAVIMPIKPF